MRSILNWAACRRVSIKVVIGCTFAQRVVFRKRCIDAGRHMLKSGTSLASNVAAVATLGLLLTVACSNHPTLVSAPAQQSNSMATIERLDPALDALVPTNATLEKVAGGFIFTEGPLWRRGTGLWFSDVIGDVVRQWSPDGKVIEILHPMGFPPE